MTVPGTSWRASWRDRSVGSGLNAIGLITHCSKACYSFDFSNIGAPWATISALLLRPDRTAAGDRGATGGTGAVARAR